MFINILISLALLSTLILIVPVRYKSYVAITLIAAATVFTSFEALGVLLSNTTLNLEFRAWQLFGPQHGAIDTLSALFLIMIGVGSTATAIYSVGDFKRHIGSIPDISFSIHYMALVIMSISMMAVVVVRSGFSFMFSWELMTISSFILMLFEAHKREVRRAALSYLLIMHVGFILLLTAFITLRANNLAPDLDSLPQYFVGLDKSPLPMFIVLLLGFGLKAGMFPLHWIKPITDPISPTHVAALMSGVMIKTGIYGIIRVVSSIDTSLYTIGLIVLAVGIVTGLWGIIMASAQSNMKRLLAYSSVENVGIMFIGIAISILGRHWENQSMAILGMSGAILHALNHSFFKPMLIMGAGSVQHATGTLSIDKLGGIASKMPITALLFIIGAAAISALPPLNGFVGEFLIYSGLFEALSNGSAQAITAITTLLFMTLIGGIVIISFTKLFGVVFLGTPRCAHTEKVHEVNSAMIVASVIPLVGVLFIGLAPSIAYKTIIPISCGLTNTPDSSLIETIIHSSNMISVVLAVFIGITLILWYLRKRTLKGKEQKVGDVWGCGFTAITRKMQYTGESFSDELHSLTESVTRDKLNTKDSTKNSIFPSSDNFEVKHKDKVETLFTRWWIEIIRMANAKIDLFVTNKVNHYVFYALGFLIFIFLLSILNLL